MSAFMEALFAAKEVKASARVKDGAETRTITLRSIPKDTTAQAFADAAKHGIDLNIRIKTDEDRGRTISGKGVTGEKAVQATCEVMGFELPKEETKEVPNEEQAKPVNRIPVPSRNQVKKKDGATAPSEGA